MTEQFINRGALVGRRLSDPVAGTGAQHPYEILLPTYNWQPYGTRHEKQWGVNGDKMHCVTQAHNNACEKLLNFYVKHDLLSFDDLQFLKNEGYFDSDGNINLNERIPSVMNGTTKQGNWLYVVADWAERSGLFPHHLLADDVDLPWDEYYRKSLITPAMLKVGKEFEKRFALPWQWINLTAPDFVRALKQAPLVVVKPGHATNGIHQVEVITTYEDTYAPFIKQIHIGGLSDAQQILLKPKKGKISMAEVINDGGVIRIEFGAGKPKGFNIGVASSALFNRIQQSGERIINRKATTAEEMTLSDGIIIHKK